MTSLSWRSWEKVTRTWKSAGIVESIARASNPTSPAILVCLPEVSFGGKVVRDHAVRAQTKSEEGAFASEDFGGILGDELLRQFEVTFDLGHDRIFLRRDPACRPDPYKYATIGIQFGKGNEGSYRIMSVWKNSPAAQAGLQPGDILRAINGEPTDPLTLEEISQRLHAKESTLIELATQRDQRRSVVTLPTHELLCRHGVQ